MKTRIKVIDFGWCEVFIPQFRVLFFWSRFVECHEGFFSINDCKAFIDKKIIYKKPAPHEISFISYP